MKTLTAMLLLAALVGCSITPKQLQSYDHQYSWTVDAPVDSVFDAYRHHAVTEYTAMPSYNNVYIYNEVENDIAICRNGYFPGKRCFIYMTLDDQDGETLVTLWGMGPLVKHTYVKNFKNVRVNTTGERNEKLDGVRD